MSVVDQPVENGLDVMTTLDIDMQDICHQRRGRAGRTRPGTCYRLYPRKDFDTRPLYTLEEIYRTDLSEVVLQMADLGIRDFQGFDFISSTIT